MNVLPIHKCLFLSCCVIFKMQSVWSSSFITQYKPITCSWTFLQYVHQTDNGDTHFHCYYLFVLYHHINSIPVIIKLTCLKPISESIIHLFIAAETVHFDSSFSAIRAVGEMFYSSVNYANTISCIIRGKQQISETLLSVLAGKRAKTFPGMVT